MYRNLPSLILIRIYFYPQKYRISLLMYRCCCIIRLTTRISINGCRFSATTPDADKMFFETLPTLLIALIQKQNNCFV